MARMPPSVIFVNSRKPGTARNGQLCGAGCPVTARALARAENLCWDSLSRGDTMAIIRQAAVCDELREFGVCVGLLEEI